MVYEDQLFADHLLCVRDGEVVYRDGHPMPWRAVVKRRWGWPKSAAYRAADYLQDDARAHGAVPTLWLSREQRLMQVDHVVRNCPGIVATLAEGLAANAARDAGDAGKPMAGFSVYFDDVIREDGLLKNVLHAIGVRFGTTVDSVRKATHFTTTRPDGTPLTHPTMRVAVAALEGDT